MAKALKKILFIDDDESILSIGKVSLQALSGVTVKTAKSGEEGLTVAREFLPDLILLDVLMPGLDGVNTFQAMQKEASLAKIPVVFLTVKSQKWDEYRKLKILDILEKPFNPLNLASAIKTIWEKQI